MIAKVMIGFAALLSTILIVAATQPKTFRIQRSVTCTVANFSSVEPWRQIIWDR
jgi:hypothetical protein